MAKVQRLVQFKMLTFLRRRRTLEESLSQTGLETQTMVERLSVFFQRKNQLLTRSWPLDWRGYFGGLSTKFGYSIPWSLDFEGHSVKWPLV
jgi:hypothetical protein